MVQQLYKEQRRDLIMVNFLRTRGHLMLDEIREGVRQEKLAVPFADMNDNALREWLMSIDGIESRAGYENFEEFFVRPQTPASPIRPTVRSSSPKEPVSNKRKNSSPLSSQPAKRSALPVLLKAAECRNRTLKAKKISHRAYPASRQCQPYKTDAPNLYSTMLIGDDNFLNLAVFDLKFEATRRNGIRQSGGCVSGLKIADATRFVMSLDSERVDRVIINVGSVDIAEGRPLIRMITDFLELINVCIAKSISPILTTLTPMLNYLHNDRRSHLLGFNTFIRTRFTDVFPIIDLFKGMTYSDGNANWNLYQAEPRFIGGSKKAFVLWNRAGRLRMHDILENSLGFAMILGGNHIGNNF